jgi:hypothetical protein
MVQCTGLVMMLETSSTEVSFGKHYIESRQKHYLES